MKIVIAITTLVFRMANVFLEVLRTFKVNVVENLVHLKGKVLVSDMKG